MNDTNSPPAITPKELKTIRADLARDNQKLAAAARWSRRTPEERSEEMRRIARIRWSRRKARRQEAPAP